MQLPVDIKAVVREATNIDEARNTTLSVGMYFDDSAPDDLKAHVRQAFASASPRARVSLSYLGDRPFSPYAGDDMAVVVAGLDEQVGRYAGELRSVGVPVMVVTSLPSLVTDIAEAQDHAIPHGDVVAPRTPRASRLPVGGDGDREDAAKGDAASGGEEPYPLDADAVVSLDERMGGWIIETCNEKRLAFALAFPFVRRPLSLEAVNSTALQNAGVGLLVIVPGADLPVMTLNQAKMLLMIAAAYGEELNLARVKELAALVGGAFACRTVARQMVSFVPALGWAIKAAVGYTGTIAMGRAAVEYYERGATLGGLTGVVEQARDKVVRKAAHCAESKAREKGDRIATGVRRRIGQTVGSGRRAQAAHSVGGTSAGRD